MQILNGDLAALLFLLRRRFALFLKAPVKMPMFARRSCFFFCCANLAVSLGCIFLEGAARATIMQNCTLMLLAFSFFPFPAHANFPSLIFFGGKENASLPFRFSLTRLLSFILALPRRP